MRIFPTRKVRGSDEKRSETIGYFAPPTLGMGFVAVFFGFAAVAAAVHYEGLLRGCDCHFEEGRGEMRWVRWWVEVFSSREILR